MGTEICLCMIVKDEAKCIKRCLDSVKPFISYWIISDTGSTDDTEQVVRQTMRGIPGELHHHPWQDFATNRNYALELARPHGNYVLIIDADDILYVNNPSTFKFITYDAYYISIIHNNISHARVQLFKSELNTSYRGVLHEYLELPTIINHIPTLPDCNIVVGNLGNRSSNPNKYQHDAEILEQALITEPDNSRHVFYLAQSYRDALVEEKALEYYLKRSTMGGWSEEVFCSFLYAAKITQTLQPERIDQIESLYFKAFHFSARAEPFYHLAVFHRLRKNFDKAFFYAAYGLKIPKPTSGLFIEDACYDWKILDEYAVAASYVSGKWDVFKQATKKLLDLPNIPQADRIRIENNNKLCVN